MECLVLDDLELFELFGDGGPVLPEVGVVHSVAELLHYEDGGGLEDPWRVGWEEGTCRGGESRPGRR